MNTKELVDIVELPGEGHQQNKKNRGLVEHGGLRESSCQKVASIR